MAPLHEGLRRLADEYAALRRVSAYEGVYWGLLDLVAREGAEYRPIPVPAELRRRRARSPGKCYFRAFQLAMERDDLLYVEGFAGKFITHHAWLTTGAGDAIDLAWDFDPDAEYIGVAVATPSLGRAALSRGEVGAFLEDLDLFHTGFGPDTLERG